MKIYVISLQRALDRRKFMVKQLEGLKLDYEIIDAVDGKSLKQEELLKLVDKDSLEKNPSLNRGAIGCALSHAKAFDKIISDGVDLAMIIEDDAILPKELNNVISIIKNEISENEIISLDYYSHQRDRTKLSNIDKKEISNRYQLIFPVKLNQIASTMAYVISSATAKKMKDCIVPIKVTADTWMFYYQAGAFSSFRCFYPPLFRPAAFTSTIEYRQKKTIRGSLASVVKKFRIPVLINLLESKAKMEVDKKYVYSFLNEQPFYKSK